MLKKKLILSLIVVLLSIVSLALAQEQEMKDYKVQQGDTLWDISNKELNDSFLWPKVWKENPEIANPDKIMPGQSIKIPLYLIYKNVQKEEPVAEPLVNVEPRKAAPVPIVESAPAQIKPLVDANLYVSSGYILYRPLRPAAAAGQATAGRRDHEPRFCRGGAHGACDVEPVARVRPRRQLRGSAVDAWKR